MKRYISLICLLLAGWAVYAAGLPDTTINNSKKWAWAATAGWINCRTLVTNGATVFTNGVVIGEKVCSGYMYSQTSGWMFWGDGNPTNGIQYSNTSSNDCGINHDGKGTLRGLGWSESLGWINFESNGNPRVDIKTGIVSGSAWTETADWIVFSNLSTYLLTDIMAASLDTDSNSLPDSWEIEVAGGTNILSGGTNDFDGDGVSDYDEYVGYTSPINKDSLFKVTQVSSSGADLSIAWPSDESRLYKIEYNDDVANPNGWTNDGVEYAASGTNVTAKILSMSGVSQRFFRVTALLPLSE